jgi:hypothetical protein
MHRPIRTISFHAAVALLLLVPVPARAADATTADCLAANNSSIDLRNDHKLRAARGELLICAVASCPTDIRKECLRRLDEVNAQVPTITFETKDASGQDLSAVKVTMDGQPLADRLEGTALSIDPGEHIFTFEAAGQPAVRRQFVILEAQKDRRESITFGEPTRILEPLEPPPQPASPQGLGTQKILAVVAGGVGVVGLGVGSVFGLMAVSKKNDAQNACPNDCADQNGVNLWSHAKTAAQVSDIAFIVGGVGMVGGTSLWFTAKPQSGRGPSAQVGLGPGSVQLKGVW